MTKVIFDKEGVLERIDNDIDLLKELFEILDEEIEQTFENLAQCLKEGNATDFAIYAHTLKGSSANVGATALSKVMAELEKLSRAGTLVGIEPLLEEAKREAEAFRLEFVLVMGMA